MTLYERFPRLVELKKDIETAIDLLENCFKSGGKILVCGNGGSSSDSGHIVGELMKGFMTKRPLKSPLFDKISEEFGDSDVASKLQEGIPCIDLTAQCGLISAFANDVDPDLVFAQQVLSYSKDSPSDILIGLSTSGNSKNVVKAVKVANALGLKTIAMTGEKESLLSENCDVCIKVPECETYLIQELHLPIYHYICSELEKRL